MVEKKAKVRNWKTHHRLMNDSDNIKINIIHMAMKGEGKENKFKVETIFAYNFLSSCGSRQRCELSCEASRRAEPKPS